MATREPSSHTSPNKRLKTLDDPHPQSPPSSLSKGKSKIADGNPLPIEEEFENEPADCCGICWSEVGRKGGIIRGYIDSCNHHFCFVCVMEWAKVESKCPLCRRRFSTIRRPPKPPVFGYERVVHVSVRDQVHHYFGNSTVGPPNPYSEAKCCVCLSASDENLILLCDLCDSAAHTYCVGLGVTVPEGDWFCQDCTILKDEHLKSETNSGVETSFDAVSVFDIVREPCFPAAQRCQRDETRMINSNDQPSPASIEIARQLQTKANARTLRQCRNLQDRIRALRDNWNGFRSGVLQFSLSPGDGNISKRKSVTYEGGRNSASCVNQKSEVHSSSKINDQVKKAWKMMDKAKSIKQGLAKSSIVPQASKSSIRKVDVLKSGDFMSYRNLSLDSQQTRSNNVGTSLGNHYHDSLRKEYNKRASLMSGKQKGRRQITEDITNCCEGSISGHSPREEELKSSKGVQTLSYLYNAGARSEKLPAGKSVDGRVCLRSLVTSEPDDVNVDYVKGINAISSSHSRVTKEGSKLDETHVDSQQYSDAKSEIQSLVKLNLKLQTKTEKLEVYDFKEVARLATHSILASCGLEDPRPAPCSIPGPVCSHPKEIWQHQKSSLMPDSCRECFYVFVKNMVNNVMSQKKSTQNKT